MSAIRGHLIPGSKPFSNSGLASRTKLLPGILPILRRLLPLLRHLVEDLVANCWPCNINPRSLLCEFRILAPKLMYG
jgi:hypothetical protein